MKDRRIRSHKRGFNLVEAAIVLGVVGLVIGGIWVAAASVQENLRLSRAQRDILSIISNLRGLYSNMPFTWGGPDPYVSGVSPALNSAVFPADSISGSQIINPWGMPYSASVLILGGASDMHPTIEVIVQVKGIGACSKLANSMHAALRQEKEPHVYIASDGAFGGPSDDPTDAIEVCTDAYGAVSDENPLYLQISVGL